MQPEEQNQQFPPQEPVQPEQNADWQQPAAPVVAAAVLAQSPAPTHLPPEPVVAATLVPEMTVPEAPVMAEQLVEAEVPEQYSQDDPAPEAHEGEEELIRWQATEHIHREKNTVWYVLFGIVVLLFVAAAVFLLKSWTFAVLVPVMAATLVIYVRRPPALIDYTLSRKGLHINDRLYGYELFKEFGLVHDDDENAVVLVPRKRFQPGVTVYFPYEVGEAVVDMLAARLPMHEVRLDPIDRLIRRLHI